MLVSGHWSGDSGSACQRDSWSTAVSDNKTTHNDKDSAVCLLAHSDIQSVCLELMNILYDIFAVRRMLNCQGGLSFLVMHTVAFPAHPFCFHSPMYSTPILTLSYSHSIFLPCRSSLSPFSFFLFSPYTRCSAIAERPRFAIFLAKSGRLELGDNILRIF